METKLEKISKIKNNPNNPRVIKDDKFEKLVKSIKEFPKMLEIRPIVVNDDWIVLGGNMRLKACKEAGLKEIPVIKASDLTEDEERQFIIKDNNGFGQWDWELLGNEWEAEKLEEWGLDVYVPEDIDLEKFFEDAPEDDSAPSNKIVLEYTEAEFEVIKSEFDRRDGSKEQIVWDLLGL